MSKFVDNVKDSIVGIQKAIKIISLGIDYKRYAKFSILSPPFNRTNGEYIFGTSFRTLKLTQVNCQYCIDFVLDSSLKLQEFDFDITDILDKSNLRIIS